MSEIEPRERTSEELQQDLKMVLGRFPARVNTQGTFGGFMELVVAPHRPHDEKLQHQLRQEVESLLDRTMLRPSTRQLLQRPIQEALDIGIDHSKLEKETLYNLLGLDLATGGAFNPFNVQSLTRRIIRERSAAVLEAQLMTGGQLPFDYELSEAKEDYFAQWEDEI